MSAPPSRSAAAAAAEGPRAGGSVALLIGAAVVVIAVVAAVLVFGVHRPPGLTAVSEEPLPDTVPAVAWTERSDGETCLVVLRPDGERERPWCSRTGGEVIAWPADGIEVLRLGAPREVLTIDPATGAVLHRDATESDDPRRAEAQRRPRTELHDGVLEVWLDDEQEPLWRVEAPDDYDVHRASVSPQGAWAVLIDSTERLLVLPADGSMPPRVWTTDMHRGQAPVWEGTTRDAETTEP